MTATRGKELNDNDETDQLAKSKLGDNRKVPIKYGWCGCGLLQCGRPYHGDTTQIAGSRDGADCEHSTFYRSRVYNPAEECGPDYEKCQVGDSIIMLLNVHAVLSHGAPPEWILGTISSISLFGELLFFPTEKLRIILQVEVVVRNFELVCYLPLWEPGISDDNPHPGPSAMGVRPIISLRRDVRRDEKNDKGVPSKEFD